MNYWTMFDRNIGVISKDEQGVIKTKRIAILGSGGMGGISAHIAARTGFENFIIADPDKYEEVNINNQFCAFFSTMDKKKAEIVSNSIKDINPESKVDYYIDGVNDKNVEEIVMESDIIYDCIDYNELYYSYITNKFARKYKKYVLAPQAVGYGASVLIFDPEKTSFNEYLGLNEDMTKEEVDALNIPPEKYAPIIPSYLDGEIVNKVVNKSIPIPNIALAQTLAASIMVAESIFILLNKRKPIVVPKSIGIDLLDMIYKT